MTGSLDALTAEKKKKVSNNQVSPENRREIQEGGHPETGRNVYHQDGKYHKSLRPSIKPQKNTG